MVRMFPACCSCDTAADPEGEVETRFTAGSKSGDRRPSSYMTSRGLNHGGKEVLEARSECPKKQEEKKQIQQLVKSFIRTAVSGVDCTLIQFPVSAITMASQWMKPARYSIDKKCTVLTIRAQDSTHFLELKEIKEGFSYRDIEQGLVGSSLVTKRAALLPEANRRRLVVLQYGGQQSQWISLLLHDEEDKELFLVAISVLRLYADYTATTRNAGGHHRANR
eukprot:Selendium_serpulae@DN5147_c0_g1_i2.p1